MVAEACAASFGSVSAAVGAGAPGPFNPGVLGRSGPNFPVPGFRGELGFISPLNGHQCRTCNRLRLTADGKLRPCLMADAEIDLKEPLRQRRDKALLSSLFQEAILMKAGFPLTHFHHPGRSMVSIGG
jgi:GTP 3',8-cyclase